MADMNYIWPIFLTFIQLLLFAVTPLLHLRLGLILHAIVRKTRKNEDCADPNLSEVYFPGLLVFLVATFSLKCLGLSWLLTSIITLLPLLYKSKENREILLKLRSVPLTFNFALWFFVILALGISLVDSTKSVQTLWINTYGDLAFHTGIISSFALADNFPPINQTFSGTTLTYPFLMNLWTASLWWPDPNFTAFGITLLIQWISIWTALYFILDGDRLKILPWATLFGGGSLLMLGTHSGENIKINYPWAVFLTTTWIPQRTALLGLLGTMTVLKQFHTYLKNSDESWRLIFAGITLAFSPLIHTHLFLITSFYIGSLLLLKSNSLTFRPLISFTLSMTPSFLSLPWLLGKESIISLKPGWMPWKGDFPYFSEMLSPMLSPILNSANMWIHNGALWFFLFAVLWWATKAHLHFIILTLLFIAGNIIQIAVWEWDQMKIFMALYVIFLSIWTLEKPTKKIVISHYFLLLSLLPGVLELVLVLNEGKDYTVYSVDDIKRQKEILEITPKDAVILAAPLHNSPVTLSGRKLFLGFPGTLYSHGLKYQDREQLITTLYEALECAEHPDYMNSKNRICPNYLLWTNNEYTRWGGIDAKSKALLEKTSSNYIYKIIGKNNS